MADSDVPDPAYERLKAQLRTMPVVEQAKGIVMAQHRCGPEEAFDILRRTSQQANVKVHVLAAFLVDQVAGKPAGISPGRKPCDDGEVMASTPRGELTVDGQAPGLDSRQRLGLGPVTVMLPSELTFTIAGQVRRELAAAVGADVSMVVADGTQTVFLTRPGSGS